MGEGSPPPTIIIDNDGIPNSPIKDEDMPDTSWSRNEIIKWLKANGVDTSGDYKTKSSLLSLIEGGSSLEADGVSEIPKSGKPNYTLRRILTVNIPRITIILGGIGLLTGLGSCGIGALTDSPGGGFSPSELSVFGFFTLIASFWVVLIGAVLAIIGFLVNRVFPEARDEASEVEDVSYQFSLLKTGLWCFFFLIVFVIFMILARKGLLG